MMHIKYYKASLADIKKDIFLCDTHIKVGCTLIQIFKIIVTVLLF